MSAQTRISSKGQVVLPKRLRDELKWGSGMTLEVVREGDAVMLRPKKKSGQAVTLDDLVGCLKYDGPPVSIEDMDKAIDEEIAARHARGRY